MIAFDTNYLVRHLVQDDKEQCQTVAETLEEARSSGVPVLLTDVVLCEMAWVLSRAYQASRKDLQVALESLLQEPLFTFENPAKIKAALEWFRKGKADFPDYLILWTTRHMGAEVKTFDKVFGAEIEIPMKAGK